MASGGETYDVVVVGAGVLGLFTAYTMVRRGLRVLLLEQFHYPHKRGSSGDPSRIIRFFYEQDYYVAMMAEAYDGWRDLEKACGEQLMTTPGALTITSGPTGRQNVDAMSDIMKKAKLPYETMDVDDMRRRFPMIRFSAEDVGLLDPQAGCLLAVRCNRALLNQFRRHGGHFRDGEKVTEVIPGDVATVVTVRGRHRARQVVLTPGPWARDLLRALGLDVPLKTLPGLPCYWREKEEGSHSQAAGMPIFVHTLPVKEGYQFIYGFPSLEYPGMIKVGTRGEPALSPMGPEDRDKQDRKSIVDQLSAYIRQRLPGVQDAPSITEGCMYTRTADGDFIIDRHPRHHNILIGAAGNGHAYKMAPIFGKLLTEMATGSATSYNIERFRVTRFKTDAKL